VGSGLLLGPFVPVDPDLDRIGEVGADLDERRAEVGVPHIEVVAAHPPVGLLEREPGRARPAVATTPVITGEHPLELLRHPDRDDPRPPGGLGRVQERAHHVGLALILAKPHHRDLMLLGEAAHRGPEPLPDRGQQRRRRDRVAQMLSQKDHDLATDLQVGYVTVEIDAVQALQVQHHVPVQHLVHRHRTGCLARRDRRARPPPGRHRHHPLRTGSDQPCGRACSSHGTTSVRSAVRGWPHWMIDSVLGRG
jgi:hypothetical protein